MGGVLTGCVLINVELQYWEFVSKQCLSLLNFNLSLPNSDLSLPNWHCGLQDLILAMYNLKNVVGGMYRTRAENHN